MFFYPHYLSSRRFASFTSFFHFAISDLMWALNWSGELPTGVEPSAARRVATSGCRSASAIAAFSFLTIGRGTLDDVITPYHWSTSYPRSPHSATLGKSMDGERFAAVMAIPRSRPDSICDRVPINEPNPT